MSQKVDLLENYRRDLLKALKHLDYSYLKVTKLPIDPTQMDEEILETWESFSARFSRVIDIFLSKYLRAKVLADDPGFSGTLRDFVDYAEKIALVDRAETWMELRKFRNLISHEYEEEELAKIFAEMRSRTAFIIKSLSNL